MSILQRIRRIFSAKANKVVDTIENPTEISEQILRELQEKQAVAINATADVKANALKNEAELVMHLNELLNTSGCYELVSNNASSYILNHTGATKKTMKEIDIQLDKP
jgi:hypothetical protein